MNNLSHALSILIVVALYKKTRKKYFSGHGQHSCMYNLFNPVFSRIQLKERDVTTDFM